MPEETIVASWRVSDRQVGRLDALEERDVDLLRAALVADVDDDEAARLELVGDRLLGRRLDLALRAGAGEVDRLEDVGGHRASLPRPSRRRRRPARPCRRAPSSRRSSSGVDERDSASWRVIRPLRTSPASEASIVCIPCAPPVCSTE